MAIRKRRRPANNTNASTDSPQKEVISRRGTHDTGDSSPRELSGVSSTDGRRQVVLMVAGAVAFVVVSYFLAGLLSTSETTTESRSTVETVSTPRSSKTNGQDQTTLFGKYELLETVSHDSNLFTQGLVSVYKDGQALIYEGTGLHGRSIVQMRDNNRKVLAEHSLDSHFFGEGITYYETRQMVANRRRILQLTWKEKTAFVYDADTLDELQRFSYRTTTTEGWGVTYDSVNHELFVSDGSQFIHVWDAETFEQKRKFAVQLKRKGMAEPSDVVRLNELEWDPHSRTILANVWFQNVILRIDPESGRAVTIYDFQSLYPDRDTHADVFNGIATVINEDGKVTPNELWVTGKLWPKMFRVRLIEPPERR